MIDSQLTLFEGTLEDNIVLGGSSIPYLQRRPMGLRFTEMEEDVDALPQGLKIHIRAPGNILAPARILRILLARAILGRLQHLIFDGLIHSILCNRPCVRPSCGGSARETHPGR